MAAQHADILGDFRRGRGESAAIGQWKTNDDNPMTVSLDQAGLTSMAALTAGRAPTRASQAATFG